MANNRFVLVHKEYNSEPYVWIYIYKDTQTGVLYLSDNNSGGFTVMVDADGKPLRG